MTNQKRGSAKIFHAARKKWDPKHGADRVKGRPKREATTGGQAKRESTTGGRPIRGVVGRRGKPGLHERPETNQRVLPEPLPPKRLPKKFERPDGTESAPGEKPERLLPGAMPLNPCIAAFQQLLKKALGYPNTYEDHVLGQTLVKLRNKNVVIALGREGGGLQLTCKLVRSGVSAVSKFSWASAAGHGLGRKGWVTARFTPTDKLPMRMLIGWVEESHLAVTAPAPAAPKPPR